MTHSVVRTESSTTHRAAVITPTGCVFGNGRSSNVGTAGLCRDPFKIIEGSLPTFGDRSTVVVDGASVAEHAAQSDLLRAGGWEHSKVDAWTLYHREGRTVSIGLRDAMNPDVHFGVLFSRDMDPGVVALQLDRYHMHTGTPWRGTAATSALAGLQLSWENAPGKPLWHASKNDAGLHMGPMWWSRDLGRWEREWDLVHTFDTNAAYLAAAINAECAWSKLEHTGAQVFDRSIPGYWLLQLDTHILETLHDPMRPPLIDERRMLKGGLAWMTTPYAKLLADLGDRCEVIDSWTGRSAFGQPAGRRVFRTWGEKIRDALAASAGTAVHGAIKATYRDMPGALQRESMRVFRPDWAHTIIDLARANLFRVMWRVFEAHGVWPCQVHTDSLSYADSDPWGDGRMVHWEKLLPLRPGLGGFKHQGSMPCGDWGKR